MHNKVSNIPNKYFMYNKKMPYTFYQKSYLEGVRLQQSRQQGHLLLSVRIRRKDQGLGGIVNEGQHLWGRSRVFWPRDPSGSIRVKVVDEVDQIVCHISRAVDIPEIWGMNLWWQSKAVLDDGLEFGESRLTEPRYGVLFNRLLTIHHQRESWWEGMF